jgi:hypothetical protein
MIAMAVVASVVTTFVFLRSPSILKTVERRYPGLLPAQAFARLLDSPDHATIMSGFYFLAKRADPIAVPRAIELLSHRDDYVWLNAALYLGACKRKEAIPYLIKALRHRASMADPDTVRYLHAITGESFGADFERWQQWWMTAHPNFEFDWDSHLGDPPRLSGRMPHSDTTSPAE